MMHKGNDLAPNADNKLLAEKGNVFLFNFPEKLLLHLVIIVMKTYIIHRDISPSWTQIMFITKPLSVPELHYCQLKPRKYISCKFIGNCISFILESAFEYVLCKCQLGGLGPNVSMSLLIFQHITYIYDKTGSVHWQTLCCISTDQCILVFIIHIRL